MMRQFAETMISWNARFAVRAMFAYNQLIAHGADDDGRHSFEPVVNTLIIEQLPAHSVSWHPNWQLRKCLGVEGPPVGPS